MNIRLLRGQAAIRELHPHESTRSGLFLPDSNPRDVKTHRGIVLGLGLPAQVNGHDVPWGFDVGAEVVYHHEKWEKGATRPWPADGEDACWMHQSEIDGVIE